MPFTPHWLLSYGGTMGTQGEIWSNGIRMASVADGDTDPDPASFMAAARPIISTVLTAGTARIPNFTKLTFLKFNKIGPDGQYVSNTESNSLFLTGAQAVVGGATQNVMPFSVAVCVTWNTAFQRGRGSKGRIFSPGLGTAIDGEGRIDSGTVTGIATAYRGLIVGLNGIESAPGDALRCVVASGINGALNPITAVSVGNVPDTMRSRRNQLIEARAIVNVA